MRKIHFYYVLLSILFKNGIILEVVPKRQIAFESKAQADEKAQSRRRRDEPSKEVCNADIGRQMAF